MIHTTLHIEGMHCNGCVRSVTNSLRSKAGVKDVADPQPVFLRHALDVAQHLRDVAARDHAVLGAVVGREPPDGAGNIGPGSATSIGSLTIAQLVLNGGTLNFNLSGSLNDSIFISGLNAPLVTASTGFNFTDLGGGLTIGGAL